MTCRALHKASDGPYPLSDPPCRSMRYRPTGEAERVQEKVADLVDAGQVAAGPRAGKQAPEVRDEEHVPVGYELPSPVFETNAPKDAEQDDEVPRGGA